MTLADLVDLPDIADVFASVKRAPNPRIMRTTASRRAPRARRGVVGAPSDGTWVWPQSHRRGMRPASPERVIRGRPPPAIDALNDFHK